MGWTKRRLLILLLAPLWYGTSETVECTEGDRWEAEQQHQQLVDWIQGGFDHQVFLRQPSTHESDGRARAVRLQVLADCQTGDCYRPRPPSSRRQWGLTDLRGGATETKLQSLKSELGPEFAQALEQNEKEHLEDCEKSCKLFYCADNGDPPNNNNATLGDNSIRSYSMGAVPPEDFATDFGFPLNLIKVTQGDPLFSSDEAARVVAAAEAEGVHLNEYKSGKYRLGGDWLDNLPNTRAWFNQQLKETFFPLLHQLFSSVVSSPAVLRAHSVSLLKYNASHPRTDVHIDNGILALTVAMTPQSEYTGGGTYFEHFDHILEMDVGHATLRPGSVRHGGHRVTAGTRYILGAFFLLQDKVEHVRRFKNRGAELRRHGDLTGAARQFQWALELNPKCTTCLKDWAEILHRQGDYEAAQAKIEQALRLLEHKDSDALFTLGVLLSEQGKDDEAIQAYEQSAAVNPEDAELLYNLGVKLGEKHRTQEEMKMYARATQADSTFGGAWLNWGSVLAESGDLDDAETMFLQAVQQSKDPVVIPKALMNLSLLYQTKTRLLVQKRDIGNAKDMAVKAADFADQAQPYLQDHAGNNDLAQYRHNFPQQRMNCFRMVGELMAGLGDLQGAEEEFRKATDQFPNDTTAWQLLGRVLQMAGGDKENECAEIAAKIQQLARGQ